MDINIVSRIQEVTISFTPEEAVLFRQLIGNARADELVANAEMVNITIDPVRMEKFINSIYNKINDRIPTKLEP